MKHNFLKTMVTIILSLSILLSVCIQAFADSETDIYQNNMTYVDEYGTVRVDGHPTGCAPVKDESIFLEHKPETVNTKDNVSLPSSLDLSASNYFPQIGDQGSISSSTAWATTYYQFGYQIARLESWNAKTTTSKQFSPKWTYNFINDGNNIAVSYDSCYKILKAQGAVRYSEFTPTGINTPSEYRYWYTNKTGMKNALHYKVSNVYQCYFANLGSNPDTPITSNSCAAVNELKSLLNTGKVLTMETYIGGWDFRNLSSQYNTSLNGQYVCIKQNGSSGFHAMSIVGYDDNISYDLNGNGTIQSFEKGAFKIANSWGSGWTHGNQGFIWVMYDALNTVSNANVQNSSSRTALINNSKCYYMSVEEYPLDLTAEVTYYQKDRSQIRTRLGNSSTSYTSPSSYFETIFHNSTTGHAGPYNFSGSGTTYQTKTFVFDYANLFSTNSIIKNYYVTIRDIQSSDNDCSTIVSNIKLIDSTGKTVVNDTVQKTITSTTKNYKYRLGIVGDINNDGIVSLSDVTKLQQYLANLVSLSSDALKLADVNGDGSVNSMDVTCIQNYTAQVISSFPNGLVQYLG